jgi:hypothetical protein
MSLIQDAWDGRKSIAEVSELAEQLSDTKVASGSATSRRV